MSQVSAASSVIAMDASFLWGQGHDAQDSTSMMSSLFGLCGPENSVLGLRDEVLLSGTGIHQDHTCW